VYSTMGFVAKMRKKAAGIAAAALVMCGWCGSAYAFDDSDCSKLTTVSVPTEQEPFAEASGYAAARQRALQRAYKDAASQVAGLWLESEQQNKLSLQQDQAFEEFKELDKAELAAFVRPTSVEEKATTIAEQSAVSLDVTVTVCVPKAEFLARWKAEKAEQANNERESQRKAPQAVDPATATWFDPKTGQPVLWYWENKSHRFAFFDNKGFNPDNGEVLQPVTKAIREEWLQVLKNAAEAGQREKDAQAAHDEIKRQEELHRADLLSHAGSKCDELAGNVYDPRRPQSTGSADFSALKERATDAVEACQAAVQQAPTEARYKYQLARAFQVNEPAKAVPILEGLMSQRYPAAFDNFGWALLDRRIGKNDMRGAIGAFRNGAALGDPDAMDSLANLILDGKVSATPEQALQLLRRAASMGHLAAQSRLSEAEERAAAAQQQLQNDEQGRQLFLGITGGLMQGMLRR
jgi:hypothetical protein